jgi:uncharacterized membrane protein
MKRILLGMLLGASLLANAAVIGFVLRDGDMRGGRPGGMPDLPPELRTEYRAVLKENRGSLAGPVRALRDARHTMMDVAMARPYDRTAVMAAMTRVRDASIAVQDEGQRLLLIVFDRAAE